MVKSEILSLLERLNLNSSEYYVLSSGSLVLRDIISEANDLDLCISNDLF